MRVFNYEALEKELGEFPRWKKFDGMPCKFEKKLQAYIILGTEQPVRIIEKQWTKEV